jgi:hypothetical protein
VLAFPDGGGHLITVRVLMWPPNAKLPRSAPAVLNATGLMKVVFCYALPTVVQGFGANETLHFRTTIFWAQLLLEMGV